MSSSAATYFLTQEKARLRAMADLDGVVLSFLPQHVDVLPEQSPHFELDLEFEKHFAQCMEQLGGIGVYVPTLKPIPSACFKASPTSFPDQIPRECIPAVWTAADLDDLRQFFSDRTLNNLYLRGRAAIGRLLCHPPFLTEIKSLQNLWRAIPDERRPPLPVMRPMVVSRAVPGTIQIKNRRLKEFTSRFAGFLDCWQLSGMTTWQIPEPMEFHPEDLRVALPSSASLVTTVSGLIVVDRTDGRISDIVRAQHRQFREERGLTDLESKWESYATIADLMRWDLVLKSRLTRSSQDDLSRNQWSAILADFLHRDADHVRRLLRTTEQFRNGKRVAFPVRRSRKQT